MKMNISTNTQNNVQNKNQNTKLQQSLLLSLTGFLLSLFVLLNILYAQNPLGGWVTPFGNMPTSVLLSICLFGLLACLVALWRSATPTNTTSERTLKKSSNAILS